MASSTDWWRSAVVYQVYLRSFADGNGDGTGDIAGLRSRLPYLKQLGVDAIWVNPWYESPLHDGGYDVSNYRSIHPQFGTLDEAKNLIDEAHAAGLRLLVDLVPNHTSSEHPWFQEALQSAPGSLQRGRYHFLAGNGKDGAEPPNNWRSVFGGPAWSRVDDGEWYLHLFDVTQPDLNWESEEVRSEFRDIIRYWIHLGADGVRVDVAHALAKHPEYPDVEDQVDELLATPQIERHPYWDRPEVHEIVREWRQILNQHPGTMMIAEAWLPSWQRMAKYVRPDEYHQAFDFLFLESRWSPEEMRSRIGEALEATGRLGATPTWVLSNHDVVRHRTRYGLPQDVDARVWLLDGDRSLLDSVAGLRRARAAALLMLALPGSVYLYQGEELGLPEVADLPEDVLDDPVWLRSNHTHKGRDGCRVPLPWTRAGPSFGFGSAGSWLPQPPDWGEHSVESQRGVTGSTLELYREALRLRSEVLAANQSFSWLDAPPGAVAFRRGNGLSCLVNFGPHPVDLPHGEMLIASDQLADRAVPADTAVWVAG